MPDSVCKAENKEMTAVFLAVILVVGILISVYFLYGCFLPPSKKKKKISAF